MRTDEWFLTGPERGNPAYRMPDWCAGNDVRALVHGSAYFARLVRAAPVPAIRLHDLRHLHATQMLAAGVPVPVVSQRLGHATVTMTLNSYAHVLPAMDAEAVGLFAARVYGS
jgi:integrase